MQEIIQCERYTRQLLAPSSSPKAACDTSWNISGTVNGSGHHERAGSPWSNARVCAWSFEGISGRLTTNVGTLPETKRSFTFPLWAYALIHICSLSARRIRRPIWRRDDHGIWCENLFWRRYWRLLNGIEYNHSKLTGIVCLTITSGYSRSQLTGLEDQHAVSNSKGRFEFFKCSC